MEDVHGEQIEDDDHEEHVDTVDHVAVIVTGVSYIIFITDNIYNQSINCIQNRNHFIRLIIFLDISVSSSHGRGEIRPAELHH